MIRETFEVFEGDKPALIHGRFPRFDRWRDAAAFADRHSEPGGRQFWAVTVREFDNPQDANKHANDLGKLGGSGVPWHLPKREGRPDVVYVFRQPPGAVDQNRIARYAERVMLRPIWTLPPKHRERIIVSRLIGVLALSDSDAFLHGVRRACRTIEKIKSNQ